MDEQQLTCHECGREVDDSLTWCPACGVELRPEQAEAIREAADTTPDFDETEATPLEPTLPGDLVLDRPHPRPARPPQPEQPADPFAAQPGSPVPGPFEPSRRSAAIPLIIVLGLLALAGLGVAVFLVSSSEEGTTQQMGLIDVDSLAAGQCWDDPLSPVTEILEVDGVPCSDPHDNEVFALVDHPLGSDAPYPGIEQIELDSLRHCLEGWETYVGVPFAESPLDIFYIYPTEASWSAEDREIICSLYRLDEAQLVGSERDSDLRLPTAAIDPSGATSCVALSELTLELAQRSIDYFDSLTEAELAALDALPEEAMPLAKSESLLLARSGEVGCTIDDLNALVIAGSGRLSAATEFGRFLIDDIAQYGFFSESAGA